MPSHVRSNLMPPPSARQRTPAEYVVLGGIRRSAKRKNVADASALGGADRVPSVREARQIRS